MTCVSKSDVFHLVWVLSVCLVSLTAVASDLRSAEQIIGEHCVKCHGRDGKVKGKVDLLRFQSIDQMVSEPELLQSLVEVLEFDEMPPEDEPRLAEDERTVLLAKVRELETVAVRAAELEHAPIRRMNRFQYNNAVMDLFRLNCVVFALPERMVREHRNYFRPETGKMADVVTVGSRPLGKSQLIERRLNGVGAFPQDLRAEHGYDNQADHLSLSPLLMESFLRLGQSVVESDDFHRGNVGIWSEFFARPEGVDLAGSIRTRLNSFLYRAFRRPVPMDVLDRYANYVFQQLEWGVGYTEAMKSVAAAVISSPRFLYLYETVGNSEDVRANAGFELASRLSWFLWGSIPDERLLAAAESGELDTKGGLQTQFQRMLRDQKLKRFCDSFPAQWLQMDRLISAAPSPEKFPGFYFLKYRDSMHMMMEPLLLFETVLIENLSILQLLDSDFTYRSDLLEEAYGDLASDPLPDRVRTEVVVLNFKRRSVKDRRSGGVITNAGVMTMTSGPERTQPITRGAWLAAVIFNDPPDPPPADVPPLAEKQEGSDANLTLRERLSAHRERADCRGCHEQIDPLGFALENYDPIGRWRGHYENGREVDSSGRLFRRHEFSGIDEFKDALLAEKDRFARGFAAHLLSFALARELGPSDEPSLDQIVELTIEHDYRLQALLEQIVLSSVFRSLPNG